MKELSPITQRALQELDEWLYRFQDFYLKDASWFALRLPPEEFLDAVEVAKRKIPQGGTRGFKYFCGVCQRKLDFQQMRDSLR